MGMGAEIIELYPMDLDKDFDTHLAALGFGVNPSTLHRSYRREALRLNTLTDLELTMIGLKRADIPAYVMKDRFPALAELFRPRAANS